MTIIHLGNQSDIGKPGFRYHLHTQDFHVGPCSDADGKWIPYDQRPVELGPHVYATWESHHGLCLEEYESNGRDDSDFYMILWNPEKGAPESYMFATTRGWTYPCLNSHVDATPEVRAAYAAWQRSQEELRRRAARSERARMQCDFRTTCLQAAHTMNFPHWRLTSLRRQLGSEALASLVNLLTNSRIRSPFKLRLRQQVVTWLQDPSPKYKTPLSRKQMEYL